MKQANSICSLIVALLVWTVAPADAQEVVRPGDLVLMEAAMTALATHESIRGYDRPIVADTFGFGMPMRSGPDWRTAGGPNWMRKIGQRLGLAVGGGADPGEQLLLSVLPPRPHAPGADTVRVPTRVSVRIRDLDTGEFTDRVNVLHSDVVLVRDRTGFRPVDVVLTAIASGARVEDRERWAQGLPPRKPRPDRP
jgi:hypothetical protein